VIKRLAKKRKFLAQFRPGTPRAQEIDVAATVQLPTDAQKAIQCRTSATIVKHTLCAFGQAKVESLCLYPLKL
jgi:hypothetical protein